MSKLLIKTAAVIGLWMLCFSTVFWITGCKSDPGSESSGSDDTTEEIVQEPDVTDPYPWASWETCAHNIGDHPCNFSLVDQNGETVELYEHYGKVIVVDFSAIWCGVCRNIAHIGDEWVAKYGEENFIWITVLLENSAGEPPTLSDIQSWASTYNVTVPVLAGSRDMIDVTEPLEDGYPITSWPTLVVIDRSMVLKHGINGWSEVTVASWVESLL